MKHIEVHPYGSAPTTECLQEFLSIPNGLLVQQCSLCLRLTSHAARKRRAKHGAMVSSPLLPIVAYAHFTLGPISSVEITSWQPNINFVNQKLFSKPLGEEKLSLESVLLVRNWSQYRGNLSGSTEFSCQVSLGIKGLG